MGRRKGSLTLSRLYKIVVILVMIASTPILGWGVVGALRSNSNDPRQWLPTGFEETITYEWLQGHFGNDEITVVSWPGCTLQDPRAEQLAQALTEDSLGSFFEKAVTGRQIVLRLISPPLSVPPAEAIQRLKGTLIGPDGASTCVMATVSPRGVEDRAGAIAYLQQVAKEACGLEPEELRLGGPTVDAATIDVESQRMLLELAGLSGLVATLIAWLRIRSVQLTAILLVISVYCTALAMAILYYTGGSMNLVMTMLPPLVFVLGVSAVVHLMNYYRDALLEGDAQSAPLIALRHGWQPCVLASGTTGLGLLSLAVSEIVPVKMFGIYSAAGVMGGMVAVLVLLPVALSVWPMHARGAGPRRVDDAALPWIDGMYELIRRRHTVILIVFICLMGVTGYGLQFLRSTVKLQYRFSEKSRILSDYHWLEDHLGPLVPMELVLDFRSAESDSLMQQVQEVALVERQLQQLNGVGAALSAADFAPTIPTGSSVRDVIGRAFWKRKAAEIESELENSGFFARDEQGHRLWRISIRASALGSLDYGRFIDSLREQVNPLVTATEGMQVTYTGVIPLFYKAQREMLSDLTDSFLMAFCLIAAVMMAVLKSFRAGLTAMLPNVFPVIVVFGKMGWLGIWIEIGSIMTTSAAMGIAVDDTFHLLVWNRRGLRERLPQADAVRYSLERCAGAMFHTTLICSCALLVFSFSSFMPVVRFARLMAVLLSAALIGDLILLPAILIGPLGRAFRPRSDE